MTSNFIITNEIIGCYTTFLLDGFTIHIKTQESAKILVSTIKEYLCVVNTHYRMNNCGEPWDPDDNSNASILLREQSKFEKEPDRREPLHPYVIQKMCELAKDADPLSFQACVWDFTGVGRFGGFRSQEFAMDSKKHVKMYVLPDGTLVVRAFTTDNFIMYDGRNARLANALQNRATAKAIGTLFVVQKNRRNGQIIKHQRLPVEYKDYCPVELAFSILTRAQLLGRTEPDDALCVYKDTDGEISYLTGDEVTKYYRSVVKLVIPNISDAELKLISTHSIRVTACVLLHEAGKDGTYIKLRLRWLSDCFEIYCRNTETITAQHVEALDSVHQRMLAVAAQDTSQNDIVFVEGNINLRMDDLEDED